MPQGIANALIKRRHLVNNPFILGTALVLVGPVVMIVGLCVVLTAPVGVILNRPRRMVNRKRV